MTIAIDATRESAHDAPANAAGTSSSMKALIVRILAAIERAQMRRMRRMMAIEAPHLLVHLEAAEAEYARKPLSESGSLPFVR